MSKDSTVMKAKMWTIVIAIAIVVVFTVLVRVFG